VALLLLELVLSVGNVEHTGSPHHPSRLSRIINGAEFSERIQACLRRTCFNARHAMQQVKAVSNLCQLLVLQFA
jgi:hypothetical protein